MLYLLLIFMTTMFIQISTIHIVQYIVCTIFNKFIRLRDVFVLKDVLISKYTLSFIQMLVRYMFKERGAFTTCH